MSGKTRYDAGANRSGVHNRTERVVSTPELPAHYTLGANPHYAIQRRKLRRRIKREGITVAQLNASMPRTVKEEADGSQ